MDESRSEFRIVYPILGRPAAKIGEHVFAVLDCSERGLRVEPPRLLAAPLPGTALAGEVQLAQGLAWPFTGQLKRVAADSWVIELDAASRIPLRVIYQEQRQLRSTFLDWR